MSLTAQFADDFDSAILHRGADYFRNGRVNIDSASASRIVAIVKGSSRYRVKLERKGRKIHASCTCPYFDVDLCKHIWAVMLAAEKQQLLQGEDLGLVHPGIEDDDPDDEFDEDDDDEDSWDYDEDREEARLAVVVVRDHLQHQRTGAPAVPHEREQQAVGAIEPGAVELAVSQGLPRGEHYIVAVAAANARGDSCEIGDATHNPKGQ
jgi:hypothetical protein